MHKTEGEGMGWVTPLSRAASLKGLGAAWLADVRLGKAVEPQSINC